MPEPVSPEQNAARERARRALIEARRTMSGVIGEEVAVAGLASESMALAITPDWEQLQAYLEESERERVTLREELAGLRDVVRALQSRLEIVEHQRPATTADPQPSAAPPPIERGDAHAEAVDTTDDAKAIEATSSAAESQPARESPSATIAAEEPSEDTSEVSELRERVLRALRERVFAAGTVGTRIVISPALDEPALRGILERINENPLVDHAEPVEAREEDAEATLVRVSLRAPMRWDQFGALLEQALDLPMSQADVRWTKGAVRVQLPSESPGTGTASLRDTTTPCA
jgi:hypothetical protein